MRNQEAIDVGFCDTGSSIRKQEGHRFARFSVYLAWLLTWTDLLPFVDTWADKWVNRLRVGGHGLVHRNIQKADRVFWECLPSGLPPSHLHTAIGHTQRVIAQFRRISRQQNTRPQRGHGPSRVDTPGLCPLSLEGLPSPDSSQPRATLPTDLAQLTWGLGESDCAMSAGIATR